MLIINRKTYDGVIFDLDGVIVDTIKLHFQSWQKLFKGLGISFTEADNERLRGLTREASLRLILNGQNYSRTFEKELLIQKNDHYLALVEKLTREAILPGSVELLEFLSTAGIKIALASSSKNARIIIEKLELGNYFDVIVDGNDTTQSKPDPALFLLAAFKLGLNPDHCIVIEDAESGIEAAHRAGMAVIGVGQEARVKEADYRFLSVNDINQLIITGGSNGVNH